MAPILIKLVPVMGIKTVLFSHPLTFARVSPPGCAFRKKTKSKNITNKVVALLMIFLCQILTVIEFKIN